MVMGKGMRMEMGKETGMVKETGTEMGMMEIR